MRHRLLHRNPDDHERRGRAQRERRKQGTDRHEGGERAMAARRGIETAPNIVYLKMA